MPFTKVKYITKEPIKAIDFLQNRLKYDNKKAQRILSRLRVVQDDNIIRSGGILKAGEFEIYEFVPITKGLKPLFVTEDFAIFDKPSKVLIHPNGRHCSYTILDEVQYHFGKSANIVNRIDYETSGLVVCSLNKWSEVILKEMFEQRKFSKKYLVIVKGKFGQIGKEIVIDIPIKNAKADIRVLMKTCSLDEGGKPSITKATPIKYDKNRDLTLLDIKLLTGRQHQIRVHLHSLGFPILGEPLYGQEYEFCDAYLRKTLSEEERIKKTGANRVMLHSNYLEFEYKNRLYKIKSYQNFNFDIVK